MPRMRPHFCACGCAWCPPTSGTRSSRGVWQLTFSGSALATSEHRRQAGDRQARSAPARIQSLEQRWHTRDGINGRTPTHRQRNGSRCAVEGTFPERDPAQGRRYPRGERLARRSGAARADGLSGRRPARSPGKGRGLLPFGDRPLKSSPKNRDRRRPPVSSADGVLPGNGAARFLHHERGALPHDRAGRGDAVNRAPWTKRHDGAAILAGGRRRDRRHVRVAERMRRGISLTRQGSCRRLISSSSPCLKAHIKGLRPPSTAKPNSGSGQSERGSQDDDLDG
jgi:hypothetical protein